jgi:branched-chain amino acid transport system permease protein
MARRLRILLPAWPVVGLIAGVVVVSVVLAGIGGDYVHDLVITDLVYLLLVVGLYTFVGNSGVFSFGHMGFAAVGGYAAGLFVVPVASKDLLFDSMPGLFVHLHAAPLIATLIGGGVAALFGLLTAVPLMRLGGLPASLATFALLIIVNVVAQNLTAVTNGQSGLTGVPVTTSLNVVLAWAAVGLIVAYVFQRSTLGLRLRASREDEVAARAAGISVVFERRVAWTLSAFYMGVAGALYGQLLGTVTPVAFYFDLTLLVIAMLVIGGRTSLAGAVAGTLFVATASELLRRVELGPHIGPIHIGGRPGIQAVGLGLTMLLALIFRPAGLTRGRELTWPFGRAAIEQPERTEPT